MLHLVKYTNLILERTPLLCGLLFAALLALLPISAGAQCANWDASGRWDIKQRGQHYPIEVTLHQTGRVLNGRADTTKVTPSFLHFDIEHIKATVDGTIDGDSLSIQIYWPNQTVGVYNGKVRASGRLEGEAYEKKSPNVLHAWHSQGVLKCLPQPVTPKIIKSSGKMPQTTPPSSKPPTTQPTKPAPPPPPMKVPGIVASHAVFAPYAFTGFVVLTWDAGHDHPYAEVWFKVNHGEEAFLVEQGKGSRQVMVEKGKLYTYILTDAGKTLATISFGPYPF